MVVQQLKLEIIHQYQAEQFARIRRNGPGWRVQHLLADESPLCEVFVAQLKKPTRQKSP